MLLASAGETVALLVEVEEEKWHSWYDRRVSLGAPRFAAGPPALGELVAVVASASGREDAEDRSGDVRYDEADLCAEHRGWVCR